MPRPVFSTEAQSFRRYVRLFKITLKTINFVVRLAEWDQSISLDVGDGTGAQSWKASPGGPGITRGEAQQRADFQVDSLHAMLASTADNQLTLGTLGTKTVAQWAARGVFDGAMVDFYVYDFDSKQSILWSRWFIQGAVSWSYDSASFTLESIFSRFDRIAPRTVIQEACVVPSTRILTADLRWTTAAEVIVGQELIGLDEMPTGGKQRKLREAVVTATGRRTAPLIEIETDRGAIVVSEDHRFLCPWSTHRRKLGPKHAKISDWVEAKDLSPGHEIKFLVEPWEQKIPGDDTAYWAGYLAAAYDGEGWIHGGNSSNVGFGQNPGPMLDTIVGLLGRMRLPHGSYKIESQGSGGAKGRGFVDRHGKITYHRSNAMRVVTWGTGNCIRLLGITRPKRLLPKARSLWDGRSLSHREGGYTATVLSVRGLGNGEVVSIATTAKTFFAEGFASHNCNNVLGDASCTIILANYQCNAVVLASPVPTRMVFAVSVTSFGPGGPAPHPPVPNPLPADYIDLGSVQFTSSDLAPQKKLVLTQTSGLLITLADPLLGAPVAGDTLILTPGCDKSVATCVSKYGNLPNFRGFPYIPDPRAVFFQI